MRHCIARAVNCKRWLLGIFLPARSQKGDLLGQENSCGAAARKGGAFAIPGFSRAIFLLHVAIKRPTAKGINTMTATDPNAIIHGNCIEIMQTIQTGSVDFILTDPPYLAAYKSRDNRTVLNDDNDAWLTASFAQMYRVLKQDAFAISFYGWPKVDLFFAAWKGAGFRIGGHIVFRKRYASRSAFVQYRHEAAYLLIKGNPAFPAAPLPDVMDWTYTGNKLHPTQKSIHILKPLIESFTRPGQIVLDSFAGSGSTCVAAHRTGRRYIGIELDAQHYQTASARLATEKECKAA
jgi:adenine-specific DNA-methyltransferase